MNFSNQEQIASNYNNRQLRKNNYNSDNNIKITKKREKLKSEKSNPEIVEFKSQDNLIMLKNQRPIQNIDLIRKDNNNEQKQLYDSKNNINKNINSNGKQHTNKSNSSVKINTKVNCKKYFGTNNSKKIINSNRNNANYYSNNTNYKEKINSNISSNNFNIIFPGQNSVKINGNKMIKHYNNSSNNVNNNLAMTKSSIQISGNYPLNQSQNIYNVQSKIESKGLNIEGIDILKEKYDIDNNENYSNKEKDTKKKYIINDNYKNKKILIKREPINRIIKNNSDKLTNKLIENENFGCRSNQIEEEKRNRKIYDNCSPNNFKKSNLVESGENNRFAKNSNEYNNIFFYNSNNNKNDINENFVYRENINGLDLNEYNNDKNHNYYYDNYYIKNKSNEISANNIKENKIKNKFVYKKSGNLSEKKLMKINSTKITSYARENDGQFGSNYEQKIIQRINKEKGEIKDKKLKTNNKNILKNKRSDEIKRNKDINYYERHENKSNIKNENNKKIIIKNTKVKNKLKNTYNIIDFKLKIPDGKDLDKEVIIPMNIKEDDLPKKVENIMKDYYLNDNYYEPLLSLINNSIDILNDLDSIKIEKKNYNSLSFKNSKEISEINVLNYSFILDLIDKKIYKEYIENIYSDIDEINENAKILNLSI